MTPTSMMSNCKHCKKSIAIRNPSGFCDHLYYPEYCNVCNGKTPPAKGEEWEDFDVELGRFIEHRTYFRQMPEADYKDMKSFIHSLRSQAYEEGKREAIEKCKDLFYKMLRVDNDLSGSVSGGCPCVKCKNYTNKMIKKFDTLKGKEKV